VGDAVIVELEPEGPQRGDLADDFASALEASPAAAAFFDTLAQFYRKAYLRWIDATTRRPEVRAARIAEVVDLLAAGVKERPRAGSLCRTRWPSGLRQLLSNDLVTQRKALRADGGRPGKRITRSG